MRIGAAREFLDQLLAGHQPTRDELHELVKAVPKEDEVLDYKAGVGLSADSKAMAVTLREYGSAYGNTEGGVLLIGYDEKRKVFDGAKAPGRGTLEEWAATSLAGLAPYFTPPIRLRTVNVDGEEVLLIGVPRAPGLVPTLKDGRIVHWIRFGTSNHVMPDHLVADIVLGRRQRPVVAVELVSVEPSSLAQYLNLGGVYTATLRLAVAVENVGLPIAEDVQLGLAAWQVRVSGGAVPLPGGERTEPLLREIPTSLRPNLDIVAPPAYRVMPLSTLSWYAALATMRAQPFSLRPFEREEVRFHKVEVAIFPNVYAPEPDPRLIELGAEERRHARGRILFSAGVYVIARGMPPDWYRLRVLYEALMNSTGQVGGLKILNRDLTRVPFGERPIVGWDFLAAEDEAPGSG